MTLLDLDQLSVQLGGRTLVRGVSLRLAAGELLGLIGPNGAGKSTLLKAMVHLLPYSGEMRLLGDDPKRLDARERACRLAYLSQDDRVQWPLRVMDLVALGRHPHQPPWCHASVNTQNQEAINRALHTADLWHLRDRSATAISGGERARARLARALVVEAPVLLADEPVAALDPLHQLKVMQYLRDYCHAEDDESKTTGYPGPGRAAIVVMHDLSLASRFCDRLLLLHQGVPVALGRPGQVLTPEHLRDIYGIRAVSACHQGQTYVLPWAVYEPSCAPDCPTDPHC